MTKHVGNIETGIRPLVEALNAISGVETLASCEGHTRWIGALYKVPYVYFRAPTALAEHIASFLAKDAAASQPHMEQPWAIHGLFHPERGLCFHLMLLPSTGVLLGHSVLRLLSISPISPGYRHRSSLHDQLRCDIENLAGLVRLYESSQPLQDSHFPKQPAGCKHGQSSHVDAEDRVLPFDERITAKRANLSLLTDRLFALDTIHHSHTNPPEQDISAESLAEILVRALHISAASHGAGSHTRIVTAEALAITFVRTVGLGQMAGSLAPKNYRGPK